MKHIYSTIDWNISFVMIELLKKKKKKTIDFLPKQEYYSFTNKSRK